MTTTTSPRFPQLIKPQVRPKLGSKANELKNAIIGVSSSIGLGIHFIFIPLFVTIGANEMALINVASVVMWITIIALNSVQKQALAIYLICLEVSVHAIAAVCFLGLSAGFQYYLWPVAVLAVLNPDVKAWISGAIAFSCVIVFASLYHWFAEVEYSYLYASFLPQIHFINIVLAGIPLVLATIQGRLLFEHDALRLKKLATVDELTGLLNRRHARDVLEQCDAFLDRNGYPYCVALGDVDFFKKINDTHGHNMGDEILRKIANCLQARLRKTDFVCRWGGEEFLIIFPSSQVDSISDVVEILCTAVPRNIAKTTTLETNVTMSFGVTAVVRNETIEQLIARADRALYIAKNQGRNQVVSI